MRLIPRISRLALAIVVATGGMWFAPAIAASGKGAKVRVIGMTELQNEYGASGGGGGGTPTPVEVKPRVLTGVGFRSPSSWAGQDIDYGSESSFPNPTGVAQSANYSYTEVNETTYSAGGSMNTSFKVGADTKFFSIGNVSGGVEINGSVSRNSSTTTSRSFTITIPKYTTLYYKVKYKTERYINYYSVWGTYSDGSESKLTGDTSVYRSVKSTLIISKKCDRITGWCSDYN